jgi:hypothetical protein
MIFGEKIELQVYVNQHDSVSDIQTLSHSWFLLCFLHELLMSFTTIYTKFRSGRTRNTHSFQLVKWLWTAMHPTTSLKLNKVHSVPQTWCPELNPRQTKCSRDVFSPTMIHISIVLAWITINCPSTAHIRAVLKIIKEMDHRPSKSQVCVSTVQYCTELAQQKMMRKVFFYYVSNMLRLLSQFPVHSELWCNCVIELCLSSINKVVLSSGFLL